MNTRKWVRAAAAVFFAAALCSSASAQKIKVGYWTSGVSLGFGSTIEQMKFLEKQGYSIESYFVHANCYALNAVRK